MLLKVQRESLCISFIDRNLKKQMKKYYVLLKLALDKMAEKL